MERVMERVLKMCCRVLPVYAFFAAVIANSGPEIKNRCTEVPEMTGCAAVIANSGLEIKNRCTDYSSFDLLAASILNSWSEIKNRCTEVPEMIGYAAVIANSGPEIKNRCTEVPEMIGCAASIRKFGLEIENLCSAIVPASRTARLQRSRGAQAGTGCHEGGIILSKKPPEWHLSPPQQRSASEANLLCRINAPRPNLIFIVATTSCIRS